MPRLTGHLQLRTWTSNVFDHPPWLDGQNSDKFFFSVLQKLEQRAKKCVELRGE